MGVRRQRRDLAMKNQREGEHGNEKYQYEEDEYHNLRARAVDFAGNDNQTSPIRVLIDNQDNVKPNGSLLYPFSGQTLNGLVNIIADASDDRTCAPCASKRRIENIPVNLGDAPKVG